MEKFHQFVLNKPEEYRTGKDFKATNKVFPINIFDQKLIYKEHTTLSTLANIYYTYSDKLFFKNRKLSSKKSRLEREIFCLEQLNGFDAPKLYAHNQKAILREYLEGSTFQDYKKTNTDKVIKLEDAFDSLQRIHSKNICIGDAHVKNIFIDKKNKTYWLDFDGKFSKDIITNKAIDTLKFVYSTYTVTKSHDITCINAQNVRIQLKNQETRKKLKELLNKNLSSLRLWLPTRISKPTNNEIKKILTS